MKSENTDYLHIIQQIKERYFDLKQMLDASTAENMRLKNELDEKNQSIASLNEWKSTVEVQQQNTQMQFEQQITNYQEQIAVLNEQVNNFNQEAKEEGRSEEEIKGIVREIDDCIALIKNGL